MPHIGLRPFSKLTLAVSFSVKLHFLWPAPALDLQDIVQEPETAAPEGRLTWIHTRPDESAKRGSVTLPSIARNKSPGTSGSRRSDDFTPCLHGRCPEGSVRSC